MDIKETYQKGKEKLSNSLYSLGSWAKNNSKSLSSFALAGLAAITLSSCNNDTIYRPNNNGRLVETDPESSPKSAMKRYYDIMEETNGSKIFYNTEPDFNPEKDKDYELSGLRINGERYNKSNEKVWNTAEKELEKMINKHYETGKEMKNKGAIDALKGE